ncbi:hypothetical protein PIB30_044348 [Stylosanthes scabra]|uniref:Retrotransposon gag domain-containing protein n=1 Tax=Stylosanthes scabra TaxID=79078 RepID=A0ABU6RGF1_9FABA|nr:hypothetical protein [Stylosanthes scabra]
MLLINASDAIQFKAFTITFKKDALTWFNYLPPNSIECFSDLVNNFMKNFTTRRRLPKTCLNLYSAALMALVKGLREDTTFLKSLTKRPPKTMEEIQERTHDYLQSYYNPLNVSLTQFMNEVSQVERVPAPRPIKNIHRRDRNSYCKYHKQNGHDTEECRDLLDFVEQRLKNGKFREYTSRYKHRDDDRRVRQRMNSPKTKADKRKDEPKERDLRILLKQTRTRDTPTSESDQVVPQKSGISFPTRRRALTNISNKYSSK